jgi:hypothetical protein
MPVRPFTHKVPDKKRNPGSEDMQEKAIEASTA